MLLDPLQSRLVLRAALENRFAVLAVNADSPAAITDVLEAALVCDAPVMIEASLWQLTGLSFGAGDPVLGMARYLVDLALMASAGRYRNLPILFHTDHIRGPGALPLLTASVRGLSTGVDGSVLSPSTVSVDSSQMGESENVEALVAIAAAAAGAGRSVTLEMEAGVDDGVTDLETAARLLRGVEERAPDVVHLWAPGVGTRHGLGDQSAFSAEAVARHLDHAGRILGRPVGIALHGSSGLSPESLRRAVEAGVVKVNWSSESLRIRSIAARDFYALAGPTLESPGQADWKSTAMDQGVQTYVSDQYRPRVVERIRFLGSAGRGDLCRAALSRS